MPQVDDTIKKERVKLLLTLSREMETNYMKKYLNIDTSFIPEIYDNGYLIGHTENFLLIKAKGNRNLLKQNVKVTTKKFQYPYIYANLT